MGKFKEEHKTYFYDMPIDLCCVIEIPSQKIIEANIAFESILGWKNSDIINHPFTDFTQTEKDKVIVEKAFSKPKIGIRSFSFETEFRTKNNLSRYIDWKCYWDEKNNWIFAIGRDITAHKDVEKQLTQQAQIDPQTGMVDRRAFLALLDTELHSALRHHYATAVILISIDQFKESCMRQGMQKGDELIKHVALALKTSLRRKTDFLARFDTHEFAVLVTHNDLEKALKVAEYLRGNLEKQSTPASFGVAAISENEKKAVSADALLSLARNALETSCSQNGNRVNFASV